MPELRGFWPEFSRSVFVPLTPVFICFFPIPRGCLTQEKIVAGNASRFIVIADFRYECSVLSSSLRPRASFLEEELDVEGWLFSFPRLRTAS